MQKRTVLLALFAVTAMALHIGACQAVKSKLGIKTTVDNPAEDSPEWVVQQVMKAGKEKDFEAGWKVYRRQLHSEQLSAASQKNWKDFKYKALRKKVDLYLSEEGKFTYEIERVDEEPDGGITIFVHNKKSDMPTPCTMIQDSKADNAWKIKRCSL